MNLVIARSGLTLLVLALLAPLFGCSGKKVTEIVVSVATDLKTPPDKPPGLLEVVRLEVLRNLEPDPNAKTGSGLRGEVAVNDIWDLRPVKGETPITLPATIGLTPDPGRDLTDPILIRVIADVSYSVVENQGLTYTIVREARLPFVKDRVLLLRMNLLSRCVRLACPVGQTCGESGCQPIDPNPDDLPDYQPDAAFAPAPDVGVKFDLPIDSGMLDGISDIGPDGATDSATDGNDATSDGPPIDGPIDAATDRSIDAPIDTLLLADYRVDSLPPDAPTRDTVSPDTVRPDTLRPDTLSPDTLSPDLPPPDINPDGPPFQCVHPTVSKSCYPGPDGHTMCFIPKGCFYMGSQPGSLCRDDNDEDYHAVTLTHDFEIMDSEVIRSSYRATMSSYDPSILGCHGSASPCPVHNTNWHHAAAYCNKINSNSADECYECSGSGASVNCTIKLEWAGGNYYSCPGYRLPTEAEWEYAVRAGTTTSFYSGDVPTAGNCQSSSNLPLLSSIAWWGNNAQAQRHQIRTKAANAWGLHDMSGNLTEWCYDSYIQSWKTQHLTDPVGTGTSTRVLRGGSYSQNPDKLRSAHRQGLASGFPSGYFDIGFRCARTR
jgi:sulfatase modifying factor 1